MTTPQILMLPNIGEYRSIWTKPRAIVDDPKEAWPIGFRATRSAVDGKQRYVCTSPNMR
ncbi:hypothetical protein FHS26_006726 [Rhizobium pisi]|jgi:hypothetical protein|uniref:Uncharacterized protein n=1 Tax=Rhizobium pisi TaxID=574561 RepID=A0A7W5BTW6_9HYPH|nr:hypothetical protein [Rhizobium pisi]